MLFALLLILLVWQGAAVLINTPALPSPLVVIAVFLQILPKGLAWHALVSTYRVVISIILAIVVAAPLGLALGQSKRLDRLAAPLIYLTYPIPKIILLPIILIFLGIGDMSKVFIISLILCYQVLVVVRDASNTVRPELIHSVRSLGAGRGQLFRYVYIPACLPAILTALRISVGTAVAVLFFVESFGTTSGLGYHIIVEGWGRMAYAEMYAGVVAMGLLGFSLYLALDLLEKRFCGWVGAGS